MLPLKTPTRFLLSLLLLLCSTFVHSQQVTGIWKGKIDKKKVEIKIIQKGDSLTGTAYYYESASNYRRFSVKGYFDKSTNSVVWWDDQLIEDRGDFGNHVIPLLSVADFNCPGGGEMYLDGKASIAENPEEIKGNVALTKLGDPYFPDEWDFVVDNYTIGANDPDIIDSVFLIAFAPIKREAEEPLFDHAPVVHSPPKKKELAVIPMPAITTIDSDIKPLSIEEKFISRQKKVAVEIPIEGDSVELRFYDNAQIDGDSISLFLNEKLLFTNIRLSDKAYIIKLAIDDLNENNELTMVAENLGTIPPNTSFMVALVGEKRYEAKLASTEHSSAMIRLQKPIQHSGF